MNLLYRVFSAISDFFAFGASWVLKRRETLRKTLKTMAFVVTIGEFLLAFSALTVDTMRKWRSPRITGFPRLEPSTVKAYGNDLTVYMDGTALYTQMLRAIRQARHHIFFETFIWKSDEVGQLFKNELIAAAGRGVEVFLVWDTFANMVVSPAFFSFPRHPHLHAFRFPLFSKSVPNIARNHRKILTVDSKIGFVGGYNIGSLYATQWRDTHLQINGPGVGELENAFVQYWNQHVPSRLPYLPNRGVSNWHSGIRVTVNSANKRIYPIRAMYLDALERSCKRVWITQAYFIPDRSILRALIAASHRGVDVRVLIPEVSNHIMADWVARSYYSDMLEAGIGLWLYKDVMVHAKTATVDGMWTTIGTANIDRQSMSGNYEVNMEIFSSHLAEKMEQIFLTDLTNARQLTLEQWAERGVGAQLLERVARPFGPLI